MKFQGISRKVTDIDAPDGMSYFQANTRMHVDQELRRRYGMCRSSLAKAAGPILGFGATFTPNGPIIGSVVSGGVNGDTAVTELWDELQIARPVGKRGVPSAPVVGIIAAVPPGPIAPPVGVVTFTAAITYDGLSGPLIYAWSYLGGGPGVPGGLITNANPGTFNFDAGCTGPASYQIQLLVTASGNPLLFGSNSYFYFVP